MLERWRSPLADVADEPMTEGLLERAHEGPRMPPPGPSPARRSVVAVVALAFGAAGVLMAVRAIGDRDSSRAQHVREPIDGWTATVPSGWDAAPITSEESDPTGSSPLLGWAVASYELGDEHSLRDVTSPDAVPRDGVFVRLIRMPARFGPLPENGARFPVELHVTEGWTSRQIATNGTYLIVEVMFGADSSPDLRAQVTELVGSIRFPELPEPADGLAVPVTPAAVVLGSASRFPVRSVTAMEVEDASSDLDGWSFFLVHAPRGFYVVYQRERTANICALRWAEADRRFVACDGRTWHVTTHNVRGKGRLPSLPVSLNFDGRLLTSPYGGQRMGDPVGFWKPADSPE